MSAEGWGDYGGRTYPKCPLCGGETTKITPRRTTTGHRLNYTPTNIINKCTHCGAISEEGGEKIFDSYGKAIHTKEETEQITGWRRFDV